MKGDAQDFDKNERDAQAWIVELKGTHRLGWIKMKGNAQAWRLPGED